MSYLFDPNLPPTLPIVGQDEVFPIHRVFCVGRNFADHAAEMGAEVDREAPFYFTKSAHHVVLAAGEVPMAPRTQSYHHEIEMVVALGKGGINIPRDQALEHVFAYSLGLDMTRRDLQQAAKDRRRPWDTAKDVEASAVIAPLQPVSTGGHRRDDVLSLRVNNQTRQQGRLSDMVWSVSEIIADLSSLYTLTAGDIILMGTPAGVGPVVAGDVLDGELEGVGSFQVTFT